jgi:hypothetical protein
VLAFVALQQATDPRASRLAMSDPETLSTGNPILNATLNRGTSADEPWVEPWHEPPAPPLAEPVVAQAPKKSWAPTASNRVPGSAHRR